MTVIYLVSVHEGEYRNDAAEIVQTAAQIVGPVVKPAVEIPVIECWLKQ